MKRKALVLVVVLVAVGATLWWWLGRPDPSRSELWASGTVEATEARLGFELAGRLAEVVPREGEPVDAGALLARLDTRELEAGRAQAVAQVAAAEARLAELAAGFRPQEIAQGRSEVAAARERLADAERDLARSRTLLAGGAVPAEAVDKAVSGRELAARRLEQAEQQLALLRQGARPEQIAAQRAVVEQASAALAATEASLEKTSLAAPFDGVVTVRHREPGETVSPGSPVVTLLDRDDRWVRIYVPEDRLGAVHLGASAAIRSDTYPQHDYRGEVVFIASQAEFTPRNVQTREERVRLVYAVKVRVVGDPAFELRPGMPVDVALALAPAAGVP
jgi:HlyD family secretion protein